MRCLDVARVEAGLIYAGSDYTPVAMAGPGVVTCFPFEIGLEWAVDWSKTDFIGVDALRVIRKMGGGPTQLTGVVVDTFPLDRAQPSYQGASLEAVEHGPVSIYEPGTNTLIGRISSRVSSPMLGRYIAIARINRSLYSSGRMAELDSFLGPDLGRLAGRLVDLPFVSFERTRAPLERPGNPRSGSKVKKTGNRYLRDDHQTS
jgi:glycine cleavage system aminomethyltransferase T